MNEGLRPRNLVTVCPKLLRFALHIIYLETEEIIMLPLRRRKC